MPEDVDRDKIDASYTDGVLNVKLPRKEEIRKPVVGKQITVK
jgi:HSP20 family protein